LRIVLTRHARRELFEATDLYARQSGEVLTHSFVDDFEHALTMLREHPRIGAPWLGQYRRLPLARFPYNIMYRITATEVRVLAIAHQRREPGYWRKRT
jgi:plasmid stabilization system protein ParE